MEHTYFPQSETPPDLSLLGARASDVESALVSLNPQELIEENTLRLRKRMTRDWLASASFEMTASEIKKLPALAKRIPAGSKISVVHLPDKKAAENADFIKAVADHGLTPVPHLAARNLKNESELKTVLKTCGDLGVTETLLIGGGLNQVQGEFVTVMDLLETGLFEAHGIQTFAVAGHPEKHPFATNEEITESYRRKYRYFTERKLDFHMITQFVFSPDTLLELAAKLNGEGLRFPMLVGVAGKCGFSSLLKYSIMCGIGNSLKVLKKEMSNIKNLALGYRPETFVSPLISKIVAEKQLGGTKYDSIAGLHVFPFGNLDKTLDHFRDVLNENTDETT